jgi:hypothetical protein
MAQPDDDAGESGISTAPDSAPGPGALEDSGVRGADTLGCRPNPESNPACPQICPERCNGKDDDCDGRSDESPADQGCAGPSAQSVCSDGKCYIAKCLDGARDCDLNPANGCEIARDEPSHCGACDVACTVRNGDATCAEGTCGVAQCHAGFAECDGDLDACETAINTLTDCGGCRVACNEVPNAAPSCETGSCGVGQCAAGYGDCDGAGQNGCETSLSTLTDCGACNASCDKASCAGGVCTKVDCGLTPGFADCDRDDLTCEIDLRADAANCGRCGFRCAFNPGVTPHGSLACTAQGCKPSCAAGYGDCDGDYRTGCEQPLNTVAHCGRCGNGCNFANAVGSCVSGSCQLAGCNQNNADCDGDNLSCEVAINMPDNCGGCGMACNLPHATARCPNRTCAIASCDANWEDCDATAANGCERDVRALSDAGSGPCLPDVGCTKVSNADSDYYFCPSRRTWADARSRCKLQRNADLAYIGDANEANFIKARITEAAWIGLSDSAVEGLWVSAQSAVPVWQGMSLDGQYLNWASGEPNGSGDCGQLYTSGAFDDLDCNMTLAFVCEAIPDTCPNDANKIEPGQCGCGAPDADADGDGFAACKDACPDDAGKRASGACGCGVPEVDRDGDGAADCVESCDDDPLKQNPGVCGCGMADTDSDGDGTANCKDGCPNDSATTTACFLYTPNNFDPRALNFANAPNTTLNCGTTTLDTTPATPTLSNWCGTAPALVVQNQNGGPSVVVVALTGLTIASGSTLRLVGSRPVVLAVVGDVAIQGSIDANASAATAGAGGNWSCAASAGADGTGNSSTGAGGGGGGGFSTTGGQGGPGGSGSQGASGTARGDANIVPLIGGCNGGRGGGCPSAYLAAGGGAVQISASGNVTVSGTVSANGAGGSSGCGSEGGGSGGGSGGAVLIEGHTLNIGAGTLTANGAGGGSADGNGGNGSGTAGTSGSNGGNGGANGGGGGGGGYGRIRTVTH